MCVFTSLYINYSYYVICKLNIKTNEVKRLIALKRSMYRLDERTSD